MCNDERLPGHYGRVVCSPADQNFDFSMRRRTRLLGLVFTAGLCSFPTWGSSCAFVHFEPSPYRAYGVEAVYSVQEDMTFLAWRLSDAADPASVTFELRRGEDFQRLDLGAAPYPADAHSCRRGELCFQYQLEGRYEPPVDAFRSVHEQVPYPANMTFRVVDRTHDIDPVAVDRNAAWVPRRFDWFEENDVVLVREFQWRLYAGTCDEPTEGEWAELEETPPLPSGWTEGPACVEVRPVRADGGEGAVVRAELVPSAETYLGEPATYVPPMIEHTTLYAILFDVSAPDADRCTTVLDAIGRLVDDAVLAADPSARLIGRYEPAGATRCGDVTPDAYPVAEMLSAAFELERVTDAAAASLLWVVVSNRTTASPGLEAAVFELVERTRDISPDLPLVFSITRSLVLPELIAYVEPIAYRAIEDPVFAEDVSRYAQLALPVRTMDHDVQTLVALPRVASSPHPALGRICQSVPGILDVRVGGTPADPRLFDWPEDDDVAYTVDLGTQRGVPNSSYVTKESLVRVEVCERFCDGPVLGADGRLMESWEVANRCARIP